MIKLEKGIKKASTATALLKSQTQFLNRLNLYELQRIERNKDSLSRNKKFKKQIKEDVKQLNKKYSNQEKQSKRTILKFLMKKKQIFNSLNKIKQKIIQKKQKIAKQKELEKTVTKY